MSAAIHVAALTPAGRGAVATIGVHGPGAVNLVGHCFIAASGRPLSAAAAGNVLFGRLQLGGAAEEVVVGVLGPDEVEVHCHGGVAAAEAVAAALVAAGATRIGWEDWLRGHAPDPFSAAGLVALSQARSQRTATILLDQYRGALRNEMTAIEAALARGEPAAARHRIAVLLARADLGRHLTQPWRVVLAGRPNAGKSSLVNALLGYRRAIVFEQPGTTRDVLTAATAFDGWPVELADTAGLRAPEGELEAAGVARAEQAATAADLVLFVADTMAAWDAALYAKIVAAARRLLIVHNKTDLMPPTDRPAGIAVSAATGAGLDALCAAISHTLVPDPPPHGAAVPFTKEQIAMLRSYNAQL